MTEHHARGDTHRRRTRFAAVAVLAVVASVLTGSLIGSGRAAAQPPNTFIARAVPGAQASERTTGVPAAVTIAQAAWESAWGDAAPGNNFFGIKCTSPNDPGPNGTGCTRRKTTECDPTCHPAYAYFRDYASPEGSFKDHGEFLRDNKRYATAFRYTNDPDRFITEVARAGYATDPNYAKNIIGIMRSHNLYRYDVGGAGAVAPRRRRSRTRRWRTRGRSTWRTVRRRPCRPCSPRSPARPSTGGP